MIGDREALQEDIWTEVVYGTLPASNSKVLRMNFYFQFKLVVSNSYFIQLKQPWVAKPPLVSHSSSLCFQPISWKRWFADCCCWFFCSLYFHLLEWPHFTLLLYYCSQYLLSFCNSTSPKSTRTIVWPLFWAPMAKFITLNLRHIDRTCSSQVAGRSLWCFMTLRNLMPCWWGMRATWFSLSKCLALMDFREIPSRRKTELNKVSKWYITLLYFESSSNGLEWVKYWSECLCCLIKDQHYHIVRSCRKHHLFPFRSISVRTRHH